MIRLTVAFLLALLASQQTLAGRIVEIRDPRYFKQTQEVIFPWAEVKLVTLEFESVTGDPRAKSRAKELHDQFLASIQGLPGAAVVTYITQPGERIENYRVTATQAARQQHAQMALWGRILTDKQGDALINARLTLVERPPGVSARYGDENRLASQSGGVEVRGVIEAPVITERIDFRTVENNLSPLVHFLSGLARYYKGTITEGAAAKPWLEGSITELKAYANDPRSATDRDALAQAHLYLARACARLADADSGRRASWLGQAAAHVGRAADLNPYTVEVPALRAVIDVRREAPVAQVRSSLVEAVRLDPKDSTSRLNLAVFEGATGKFSNAMRQIDHAQETRKLTDQAVLPEIQELKQQLNRMR